MRNSVDFERSGETMTDDFRVGDMIVVRGESAESNVGRLGRILDFHRSTSAPSGLFATVEFKEGDQIGIDIGMISRVNLQVFVAGDFITLDDIEVRDDEGKVIATSGDPAMVIEHEPRHARLKIGLMKSPDDRPFECWIDDRHAAYRSRWNAEAEPFGGDDNATTTD